MIYIIYYYKMIIAISQGIYKYVYTKYGSSDFIYFN